MTRFLLRSTALFSTLFTVFSAKAATNWPVSSLAVPQLKISGQTSFNSWFFNNGEKVVQNSGIDSPCGLQRYGRTNHFTVDSSRLKFNVDGKLDRGMDYGLVFVLDGDPSATKNAREAYIYFSGSWGTTYLGNTFGVENIMTFGGFDEWGGTGFIEGGAFDRVINYTTGTFHSVNVIGELSRDTKITYLSPRWNGFQAGISYMPRGESRGQDQVNAWTSNKSPKEPFTTESIASGINFIHNFKCGLEIALSATSLFGKTHPEYHGAPKRKDTASFAFGGDFKYEGFGFGTEYGNNTRSQQLIGQGKPNAGQFLDFGISYTWGATKFSLGYYYSWRKALGQLTATSPFLVKTAKTNAVSASIDHKLTPGLGLYLEYAHFEMKNPIARQEAALNNRILEECRQFKGSTKSNKADAFVVGSRLVF